MTHDPIRLRQIAWTGTKGTFTTFAVMSDAEFDFLCRAGDLKMDTLRDRVLHTVKGGEPSQADIEAAQAAFSHVYTNGAGRDVADVEDLSFFKLIRKTKRENEAALKITAKDKP
jgi:hypothetical protein